MEIKDAAFTLELASTTLVMGDPRLKELLGRLHEFTDVVALASFEVKPGTGATWSYEWTAKDGRVWKQKYDTSTAPVKVSMMAGGWFTDSEAHLHRFVREAVQSLTADGTVTKVEGTWF